MFKKIEGEVQNDRYWCMVLRPYVCTLNNYIVPAGLGTFARRFPIAFAEASPLLHPRGWILAHCRLVNRSRQVLSAWDVSHLLYTHQYAYGATIL